MLVVFVVGLGVYFRHASIETESTDTVQAAKEQTDQEAIKERGPRPTQSRLRDGVKQVETPHQAREVGSNSLNRINKELAQTTNPKRREKLENKKALIEQALAKFE